MPLIKMRNTKPNSDDVVQIAFTDLSRKHCYSIKTITYMQLEDRYRGNRSFGEFETSNELQDHIEKYIFKKEAAGFRICP